MSISPGKRNAIRNVGALLATGLLARGALADTYPSRPIRWVLGFPAGGAVDFVARTLSVGIAERLGQPVIIDNKPGASGMIAADLVSRSPKDGYTIFTVENGIAVNNQGLFRKLSYDPENDFASVGMMVRFPIIIAVHPGSDIRDANDLITQIRKNPGKRNYATPGIGTAHNLAMEMLKDSAGLDAVPVHYKGGAPATQDALGGQIELILTDVTSSGPLLKSGKLRPLVAFSRIDPATLKSVPSLYELKYTKMEAFAWQAMVVPAGTPTAIVHQVNDALLKTLAQPDVQAKLLDAGLELAPGSPSQMQQQLKKERQFWLRFIREKGISAETS